PREVVERAKSAHEAPTDRCYEVTVRMPEELQERYPELARDRKSRLWTRGDRYFVEWPDRPGAWGRDEDGRVWVAPTPFAAARFDPDEIPEAMRDFFAVRAVQLPQLLDELLAGANLRWRPTDPGRPKGARHLTSQNK